MHIAAIVAEYDPFHSGHAYLVQQARSHGATHVAAVLSGNFLQRGAPACFSKWTRARQALACGVDLVVELPLPWAMAGAETFARGGVALAAALGAQTLCFGSECGDAAALDGLAQALLSPAFSQAVRAALAGGIPFAAAREQAAASLLGAQQARLLEAPNNILGVEYAKAVRLQGVPLSLQTVRRAGAGHDSDAESAFPSAARIRRALQSGAPWQAGMPRESVREAQRALSQGLAPASLSHVERAVLAKLRTMTPEEMARLPDVREGLENRLYAASRTAGSLEDLYARVKTKRYSHARIRRAVLSAFLGVEAGRAQGTPPYLRVLGFTKAGRALLGACRLPLVVRASDRGKLGARAQALLALESTATDLWALCLPQPAPAGLDFSMGVAAV